MDMYIKVREVSVLATEGKKLLGLLGYKRFGFYFKMWIIKKLGGSNWLPGLLVHLQW